MQLVVFILVCYGLTQILVYGSIFNKIRPQKGMLGELFKCPMCIGFWAGLLIHRLSFYTELFTFDTNLLTSFLLGCVSSGTSYVLCVMFGDDGVKIDATGDE